MDAKVKRGLGLLAVAALAGVLAWGVSYEGTESDAEALVASLAWITALGAAVVGLALIAWGLLRD